MTLPALSTIRARLGWECSRVWEALGARELLALALLALWAGLQLTVIAPLRAQEAQQAAHLAQLAATAPQARGGERPALPTRQAFIAFLPDDATREAQLKALHTLAATHGLQIGRADYRRESTAELGIQRFTARMSLQGSYASQRVFLHELLAQHSNLAVERISLEKAAGLPDQVSTTFDTDFYYRPASERSASR